MDSHGRYRVRDWIQRRLRLGAWLQGRHDEIITQLGEQVGQQAATHFGPAVDRVIRYTKLAVWFGIAGFVVGLLALIGFLALIFDVL